MKKRTFLKSAASFALAVVLLLAMSVPALAVGDNIVITAPAGEPGVDGRFVAYQVFRGSLVVDKADEIDGIEWGSGVDSGKLLAALKGSSQPVGASTVGTEFTNAYTTYESEHEDQLSDAEFVAQWLGTMSESYKDKYNPYADAFARAVADSLNGGGTASTKTSDTAWTINVGAPGYYLVKDTYEGDKASISSYILRVLGTARVEIKATIPTVEKKVEEQDGYLTGTYNKLNYTLTGTVSKNIGEYSTYAYKFTDKLSPGLTVDMDSINVKLSANGLSSPVTLDKDETTGYTATLSPNDTSNADHTLTIEFKDLIKAIKDEAKDLVLTNQNVAESIKIIVSYKAALNEYAVMGSTGNKNDVVLTYSNDPYSTGTGETVHDEVTTYGVGLQIKKVDKDENPLGGIEFKLQNGSDQYATFKETTDSGETYYAISAWGTDAGNDSTLTTDETTGIINIHGLDVGTYTLTETKTKEGFETMKPIVFTITSSEEGKGYVKSDGSFPENVTFALSSTDSRRDDVKVTNDNFGNHSAQVTLTNYPLPILPHTGGIGAGIVYLVSALAVLTGVAIVYLAVRKRGGGRHAAERR